MQVTGAATSRLKLTLTGGVPFGVYAIVQVQAHPRHCVRLTTDPTQNFSFALKFQPQAFAGLTLISWGQTLYYHKYV